MIIIDREKPNEDGKMHQMWIWVAAFLEQEVYDKFLVRHTDDKCYTLLSYEKCERKNIKKERFPNEIYIIIYTSKSCYRIMYSNIETGETLYTSCRSGIETADWLNNRIVKNTKKREFRYILQGLKESKR